MNVKGPGQPGTPGVSSPDGGVEPEGTAAVGGPREAGKSFAEKLSGPPPTEAARTAAARASDVAVSDVAADLRAGKLTSRAAIEKVLDRVVARQIGPEAPSALRDQIRAALQDAVETDPLLADKLRQLD